MARAPQRLRPPFTRRVQAFLRRLAPIVVWVGACGAVVVLYQRQYAGVATTGIARPVVYQVGGESAGRLSELGVGLHQPVRAGQVVAGLDQEAVQLELEAARAELERLRGEIAREEQLFSISADELVVDEMNRMRRFARNLEQAEIDYLDLLARIEEDRVLLQGEELRLERQRALATDDNTSRQALEDAETRHAALRARIASSEQVLATLDRQREQARDRFAAITDVSSGELALTAALLQPHRWAVEVQHTRLEQLSLARERLSLRSPVDGVVAAILRRPGEVVAAGEPVLSVVEPRAREIVAMIDERGSSRVQAGMTAKIVRRSDRARSEVAVLRTGPRVERVPDRVTGDANLIRYGLPVYLACPEGWQVRPDEAFEITFVW